MLLKAFCHARVLSHGLRALNFVRLPASSSKLIRALAIAWICLGLGGCSHANRAPVELSALPADSLYIQPGDVVRLRIWREPDLSGDYPLDNEGVATLPKLGPLDLHARSAAAVHRLLVSRYGEFLRNPSIEVTVLRRITVQGAVRNPGVYTVDPSVKLTEALAMAGGVAPDGKPNQVQLIRDGKRLNTILTEKTVLGQTPIRSGDQIYIPQRSWISRNPWVIAAGITATATILRGLLD
jgi:protein involved in polysaccharide export with SLBB domain